MYFLKKEKISKRKEKYLDITIGRPGSEKFFVRIESHAFDGN